MIKKDAEIQKLQDQVKRAKADAEKAQLNVRILERKVKQMEEERRTVNTSKKSISQFSERNVYKAPASASKKQRERQTAAVPGGHSGSIGQTKNRILTLRQLKDTIADMYA